jgi:hypothetical protein
VSCCSRQEATIVFRIHVPSKHTAAIKLERKIVSFSPWWRYWNVNFNCQNRGRRNRSASVESLTKFVLERSPSCYNSQKRKNTTYLLDRCQSPLKRITVPLSTALLQPYRSDMRSESMSGTIWHRTHRYMTKWHGPWR